MTAAAHTDHGVPQTIGRYRVLYELGRGGMGVVYRAAPIGGGPEVALKIPFAEMADQFGCIRREILALSRLRHPGVVRIMDSGVEQGVPWYAMELLDSRSLHELLEIPDTEIAPTAPVRAFNRPTAPYMATREKPFVRGDLQRALTLMYRLARVLAYVHSHGIVHRDLKLLNVLVREGDRPVLVDFGLMGHFRAQSGREVLEVGGFMMGTAVYAAPEQVYGELVDARADLYSFGVMLYEIVTGEPPFYGSFQSIALSLQVRATPPSQRVRGVPPVLEKLIMNLLEKRRGDRLGYAEDVAAMLVEAGAEPDPDLEAETASYLYRPEIVGRQTTIESLTARARRLKQGEGGIVLLGGESGIGKTSVAAAFSREATMARCRVVTGECDPIAAQPLHPLRSLLREIADCCRMGVEVRDRVIGPRIQGLRELDSSLAGLDDREAPRVLPETSNRRLLADVAETLAAFARETPLVLILDDLQWADEATLRFLSSLDEEFFSGLPLLILGTYRADETGPDLRALIDRNHVVRMPLGRLDSQSVADLVRSMLAAPDAPESFLGFLALESEGNPFFVAEYLRTAVTERLLRRETGRWRVAAGKRWTFDALGLPATLRDLIGRRLDGLSALAQRVAEAASVLGRESPESMLAVVSGENESDLLQALAELVEHHVFEEVERGVRFVHDKLREGAYARIASDRLRSLHRSAAEHMENVWPAEEQRNRRAAELAHHFDRADTYSKAFFYYPRAAETAMHLGAGHEAIEHLNRAAAIELIAPPTEAPMKRRLRHARWSRLLGTAHWVIGDTLGAGEQARKALAELGEALPQSKAGWHVRLLVEAVRQLAHVTLPRHWFRVPESKTEWIQEVVLSAEMFASRCYYSAEFTSMVTASLLAVNRGERDSAATIAAPAYASLALVTTTLGWTRAAEHYLAESRRLSLESNDPISLIDSDLSAITYSNANCDWKRGAMVSEESVATARACGDTWRGEICLTGRGLYELYIGQLAKSAETWIEIRESARKRSAIQHESWGRSGHAKVLVLQDRLDEALKTLTAARALLEGQNDKTEAVICAQIAQVLLYQGKLREAVDAADMTACFVADSGIVPYEMCRTLAIPAEVYLEEWSQATREGDRKRAAQARKRVKVMLRALRALAGRAPAAIPVTLRLSGLAAHMSGKSTRGHSLLCQSVAEAARLGLPIEEGIGEYDLSRFVEPGRNERTFHAERAHTIFQSLGCDLYLRKLHEDGAT